MTNRTKGQSESIHFEMKPERTKPVYLTRSKDDDDQLIGNVENRRLCQSDVAKTDFDPMIGVDEQHVNELSNVMRGCVVK